MPGRAPSADAGSPGAAGMEPPCLATLHPPQPLARGSPVCTRPSRPAGTAGLTMQCGHTPRPPLLVRAGEAAPGLAIEAPPHAPGALSRLWAWRPRGRCPCRSAQRVPRTEGLQSPAARLARVSTGFVSRWFRRNNKAFFCQEVGAGSWPRSTYRGPSGQQGAQRLSSEQGRGVCRGAGPRAGLPGG